MRLCMTILLMDTLTGTKKIFTPLRPPCVTMYVCGITPYADSHVGHARVYITFDVLYRLLSYQGFTVRYCRNITDIEDKLINKAQQELGSKQAFKEIASLYTKRYHQDMQQLNCLIPTYEPKVTDHVDKIITFIKELIQKDVAYQVDGDVYFSIDHFPAYGALSKHKLQDLCAGERVEVNTKKRNPLDFALWKGDPEGLFWESPWGNGRPGWHIECSALALAFLGKEIDIHAGGLDLVFPHHENEKAQSEALHELPFARYWVHNGFVQINKEKMSKSLGNFFTIRDVLKEVDPMVLRYYLLSHHYRAPLEFSLEGLQSAEKSYRKLCKAFTIPTASDELVKKDTDQAGTILHEMLAFLGDDLNTPGMFGVLYSYLATLTTDPKQAGEVKQFLQQIIGLTLEPLAQEEVVITPEIEKLLAQREQARATKNWTLADALRDQLQQLGVQVHDQKQK